MTSVWKVLRDIRRVILELVRELSDENPYRRHLLARGVQDSPQEWRSFSDARMRAKYMRAKCC